MALALAAAGADVACAASTEERAAGTADEIRASGRTAWAFGADLGDRDAVAALADGVDRTIGRVDILVNAGGMTRRTPAADFSMEDWDLVLRTNLDSTWMLCQRFGRGMLERRSGKIINVASLLSFSGGILVPAYTASKHAVAGITKALANEWASRGVQVNAIAPGYFRTDVTAALQNDPVRAKEIETRIPAGRWGEPADIGGAAVFLASSASDYVNGHILVVDGGWMAR
jgi:2-deoxy-D-gluconate 3-dehydrogenase